MGSGLGFILLCCFFAGVLGVFPDATSPLNIGHRGDPVHAPENTVPAFEEAFKRGAHGFETDLRLTKDGVLVLSHDSSLARCTNCSGEISGYTLDELKDCDAGTHWHDFHGTPVPTFEDAVKVAAAHDGFIIMDLKLENLGAKIADVVLPLGMESRVIASCWTDSQVDDIKKHLNCTVKQRLGSPPKDVTEAYFLDCLKKGIHGFSLKADKSELTSHFVHMAHEHLMPVFSWTVDHTYTMDWCYREGHDAILTNDPDLETRFIDEMRRILFNEKERGRLRFAENGGDKQRTNPLFIGHRGNPTEAPENTLAAFRAAHDVGADGFETDLRLSKDGYIVLSHDPTLDRCTNCSGKISDYTLAELKQCDAGSSFSPEFAGEPIPTFAEAVLLAKELGMFIVMDLKEEGLGEKIAAILVPQDMEGRGIASCWTDTQVADIRKYLACGVKQKLSSPPTPPVLEDFFKDLLRNGVQGCSLKFNDDLTPEFVREAHEHLVSIFSWTVDNEDQMELAMRDGHDGVITDKPRALAAVIEKIRKRAWPL